MYIFVFVLYFGYIFNVFLLYFYFSEQTMQIISKKINGSNGIWKIKNKLLSEKIKSMGFEDEWNKIKKSFHKVFNKAERKNDLSEKIFGYKLSLYYKHGVHVFCDKWNYIYINDGLHNSWTKCIPGCIYHDYDEPAKKYLLTTNRFQEKSDFDSCIAASHFICRVCCNVHDNKDHCHVQKINADDIVSIAKHFLDKYKCGKGGNNEFALAVHVFRHVYIYIYIYLFSC